MTNRYKIYLAITALVILYVLLSAAFTLAMSVKLDHDAYLKRQWHERYEAQIVADYSNEVYQLASGMH